MWKPDLSSTNRKMAVPLVSDELWAVFEPLRPTHEPSPKSGHPRFGTRKALTGILFVLKTGLPWEVLPQEMRFGIGLTSWRRLVQWPQAGVWD